MRTSKFFLPIVAALAVLLALASCTYRRSALDMEWDYTPGQRDSIKFVRTHHYSQNYNFKVHADSLMLLSVTPDDPVRPFVDTVYVHEGDLLVVECGKDLGAKQLQPMGKFHAKTSFPLMEYRFIIRLPCPPCKPCPIVL